MTPKEKKKQIRKQRKKRFLTDVRDIFIFMGILLLLKVFVVDFGFVYGHSMEPNIKDGQLIVIKKWNIFLDEPNKGLSFYDKIALKNVRIEGQTKPLSLAKRVIGLPGDKIKIMDGYIYRNGKKIREPLIKERAIQPDQTFQLEDNEIFVMGDNRNHSTDSRHFGPIPIKDISGKIVANVNAQWLSSFFQKIRVSLHLEENIRT
jgi:signal peptidase I